jgi:hypothetical protein
LHIWKGQKEVRNMRMNRYKFIIIIIIKNSCSDISFKPDAKLSTNKIFQFLEHTVMRCEKPEQKPNGYFDADFVWKTGSNRRFLCLWRRGAFWYLELVFIFKMCTARPQICFPLRFDMRSFCCPLCSCVRGYRGGKWQVASGKWHRKCQSSGTASLCWVEIDRRW